MEDVTLKLNGPIDVFSDIDVQIEAAIEAGVKKITLEIDSPGGEVFKGFAIYSAIEKAKEAGIKIEANITVLAASMAAYLALSADYIVMNEFAQIMIHSAGGFVRTDEDMELLGNINKSLKAILKARTGKDMRTLNKWLKVDTWFSASDALAEGLVDKVKKVSKKVESNLDFARVDKIRQIYNEKYENEMLYTEIAAVYNVSDQLKINTASMLKQIQAIFEDATEENYIDKINAIVESNKTLQKTLNETEAKLEGEKVVGETLNARIVDLETSVSTYRQAEEDAVKARAETLILDAIEANKIKASATEKWLEFANSNYENTKDILDSITSQHLKLHQIAETITDGIPQVSAHDAYVASLAKNNSNI